MSDVTGSDITHSASKPATRFFGWPLAAVLMLGTLTVGAPVGYVLVTWSHAAVNAPAHLASTISQAAADAVRPKFSMTQIVANSVSDLHKESKLVVFTARLNADVTQQEAYSSYGVYWGTNVARVIAHDAAAQYVIDLSQIGTSDFIYNDQAKVLSLFVPRPKLDAQMIAVDPAMIETVDLRGGWGRFDKQETRDHAISELKPKIMSQANAPYIRQLAESSGIETTTKFLQPLADTLGRDGVTVRVQYRD
jgi:hypothetical protein